MGKIILRLKKIKFWFVEYSGAKFANCQKKLKCRDIKISEILETIKHGTFHEHVSMKT